MILIPNATVTFSRTANGITATIPNAGVAIEPVGDHERIALDSTVMLYEISYDPTLRFASDNSAPGAGDVVLWSGFPSGRATLRRPAAHPGALAYTSAIAEETN